MLSSSSLLAFLGIRVLCCLLCQYMFVQYKFPARMLEAEYEQYNERRASKVEATIVDNPVYRDDDVMCSMIKLVLFIC